MKLTVRLVFSISMLCVTMLPIAEIQAQTTGFFNYQAIINDVDGEPYEGTVGIKISILQNAADGDLVYSERHTKESDERGFISFRVGEGEEVYKGEFDTINWSEGPNFIRTDIAPGGGFAYSISSTTELLSVPMALYARTADSIASSFREEDPIFSASVASLITNEDTMQWNALSKKAKYHIGDLHDGGIIFYIEPDGEHGLIASLQDIANEVSWGINTINTNAISNYNGSENTELIVSAAGEGDYAAYYCDTLSLDGFDDWYLPSADEMFLLLRNRYTINKSLEEDGNDSTTGLYATEYWTSSEREISTAYIFQNGNLDIKTKDFPASVRAIRLF